jgi:hypothetical protein
MLIFWIARGGGGRWSQPKCPAFAKKWLRPLSMRLPRANLAEQNLASGGGGNYASSELIFGAIAWLDSLIFQQPHAKKIADADSVRIIAHQKAATGGRAPFPAVARLPLPGQTPATRCSTSTGRTRISLLSRARIEHRPKWDGRIVAPVQPAPLRGSTAELRSG